GHHSSLHLRHQPAQHRIIVTEHNRAIKGDAAHKIKKGSLHVPHVAIAVHVLAVNVGHYSKDGGEIQERAVALIGFRHQVLRADYDDVGTGDVVWGVPFEDSCAQTGQALRHRGGLQVRT